MIGLFRRAARRAAKTLQGVAELLESAGGDAQHKEPEETAEPVFLEELEIRYRLVRPVTLAAGARKPFAAVSIDTSGAGDAQTPAQDAVGHSYHPGSAAPAAPGSRLGRRST